MNKETLARKMLTAIARGEDPLFIAETYQLDTPGVDEELEEATRLVMEGAERLYNRLGELDEEFNIGIIGN